MMPHVLKKKNLNKKNWSNHEILYLSENIRKIEQLNPGSSY